MENEDDEDLYRLTPEAGMPHALEMPEEEYGDGEARSGKSGEHSGNEDDDFEADGEDFGTAEMGRQAGKEDAKDEEEEGLEEDV